MAINHVFTNPVADGTITSIVRPSDWNSQHNQAYTLAGNTAGNSVVSGTNVILQGGNNVTLSGTGQTIIVSAGAGGAGGGGGAVISAGTNSTSTGTVVFSNSNGVSFGMATDGVITASVVAGAAAGMAAIGAGTQTATSGTMNFANSNGITFGMSGSNQITASYTLPTVPGATVFSNSNNVSFGLAGSTVTASASYPAQTAFVFSNANGVSFGTAGSTVTASVAAAGGAQTGISGIIAGTQTLTQGTLSFINANGISFGLNSGASNSQITASYTVPTQTVDTNKAGTGFTSTSTGGVVPAATLNTNGLSFAIPNYITTYVNDLTTGRAGLGFTSTSTAGAVPTATLSTNGLSFAMPAYLTTAQSPGAYLTTAAQSSISNVSGVIAGTNATGGTQTLSGNVSFSNANGVSFYTSAGNAVVASVKTDYQTAGAYLTTAMVSNAGSNFVQANAVFNGTNASGTIASNGISISVGAGGGGADGFNIIGVNGGATQLSTTYQLSNANNVSFGLNAGTITASASYAAQTVDTNKAGTGFTSTSTAGAVPTATLNTNGLSFGMPAYLTTAQPVGAYLTTAAQASVSNVSGIIAGTASNGGTATLSGNVSFSNANGVSFYTSAGNVVAATVRTDYQSAGAYLTTGANSTHSHGNPTLNLTNINGTTASNSAGLTLSLSAVVPAQTVQPVAISGSNGSFAYSTLTLGNLNGLSFYSSNGSIVGSYTVPAGGGVTVLSNSNNVSFGLAGSTYTATATFNQSNQTGNLYVTANSTQLSSTAGVDLRSLSFAGAGIASVGVSGGVVVVSVPSGGGAGDGVNILQAGTTGTTGTTYSASTGTMFINGGNNITVSQNGSNQLVISAAQGGIAAGTQTATSGTLVFANSNGVTFGMSGSSQITASVNAGGGGVTLSAWEPHAPIGGGVAFSTLGQNSIYLQKLQPPVNVAFANIERRMSGSFVSSTNSQAATHTYDYGLYSRGTGASTSIYSQIATSRIIYQASISSNVSAGFTISQGAASFTSTSAGTALYSLLSGFKHMYLPFTNTITAGGEYAVAMRMSSATAIGTNALRIGVQDLSVFNNLAIGKVYATTAIASNASHVGDHAQGVYSATSSNLPSTIAISGLTNAVFQQRMYLQFDN